MKLGMISVLSLSLGAIACAPASLKTPPQFAQVGGHTDQGDAVYVYRATNADGVVVAARSERNQPAASLEFWVRAIDLRLKKDGYSPEANGDSRVRSDEGLVGEQLRYTRDEGGRTIRYWVTIFRAGDRVYVVEAGGDKDDFDAARPEVERAMTSLRREHVRLF